MFCFIGKILGVSFEAVFTLYSNMYIGQLSPVCVV